MIATITLAVALTLVAVAGTATVFSRDPARQALTLSVYGLLISVLFFVLQAPDVALAQLAIGSAVVPLMIMLAVRTIKRRQ